METRHESLEVTQDDFRRCSHGLWDRRKHGRYGPHSVSGDAGALVKYALMVLACYSIAHVVNMHQKHEEWVEKTTGVPYKPWKNVTWYLMFPVVSFMFLGLHRLGFQWWVPLVLCIAFTVLPVKYDPAMQLKIRQYKTKN